MERFDVAVVGLGTAGAAAAAFAAQRGLRVIGLDARPLDQAGARWVNGVPRWAFAAAGLPEPAAPELRGSGAPFHMLAGWGRARGLIKGHEVLEVDMRHLVARLQRAAEEAGARLQGGVKVTGFDGLSLETTAGPFVADTYIDAAGLNGAGLVPRSRVAPEDLCVAAQEVRALRDPQAARAWFHGHGVAEGETLCFTGVAGGYSILNLRWEGDELSLLTGSIPALGQPSGKALLEQFVERHAWVGERHFGGARALPLRTPFPRLGEGRVALLGDAACQVFAIHGSGIAPGLIAARCLADTLADGGRPEDYNLRWQRAWGGQLAGSVVFARFSRSLSEDDLARLMKSGLFAVGLLRDGLEQRPAVPRLAELPGLLGGAAREPGLVGRLSRPLSRMGALRALYATFPKNPAKIAAFWVRAAALTGDPPEE